MAKFQFIEWLLHWLESQDVFHFTWDDGNATKSKDKHEVEKFEAEQIFYDEHCFPLGIQVEPLPDEPRFGLLGRTSKKRCIHICFTIRDGAIRIISARPMQNKERISYEQNLREK